VRIPGGAKDDSVIVTEADAWQTLFQVTLGIADAPLMINVPAPGGTSAGIKRFCGAY
jgi:hypothetical protein